MHKLAVFDRWFSDKALSERFKFTIDSRYLELGYFEFCETRSVYLSQKYILIAFSTIIWRWRLFYKSKLPEVQINLHFK